MLFVLLSGVVVGCGVLLVWSCRYVYPILQLLYWWCWCISVVVVVVIDV